MAQWERGEARPSSRRAESRAVAPLSAAEDAVIVDSTAKTADEVVDVGHQLLLEDEVALVDLSHVAETVLVHPALDGVEAGDALVAGDDRRLAGPQALDLLPRGGHDPGAHVFDMSVGYDLKGIQSDKVVGFIRGMMDATASVERLRDDIPRRLAKLKDLDFPTALSRSITLSTFHGCPAGACWKGTRGFSARTPRAPTASADLPQSRPHSNIARRSAVLIRCAIVPPVTVVRVWLFRFQPQFGASVPSPRPS